MQAHPVTGQQVTINNARPLPPRRRAGHIVRQAIRGQVVPVPSTRRNPSSETSLSSPGAATTSQKCKPHLRTKSQPFRAPVSLHGHANARQTQHPASARLSGTPENARHKEKNANTRVYAANDCPHKRKPSRAKAVGLMPQSASAGHMHAPRQPAPGFQPMRSSMDRTSPDTTHGRTASARGNPAAKGPGGKVAENGRKCYRRKAGQQGPTTRPASRQSDPRGAIPRPNGLSSTSPTHPASSRGLKDSIPKQRHSILNNNRGKIVLRDP